jgi:hypothetical protein
MRNIVMLLSGATLAACGQQNENPAANQAAAQPKKPKAPYCFFKDSETKDWKASRDKQGNIVVKGKAFRLDSRYRAIIGKIDVGPAKIVVWPTIEQNDTAYGAPDNWWDVKAAIPNSAALDTVEVHCGDKTIAQLKVPPKG